MVKQKNLLRVDSITDWLKMSQEQVLDKFHSIPTAFSDGHLDNETRFVYIPGTRDDRVLLVAHADTVFGNADIKVGLMNGILFSMNQDAEYDKKDRSCKTVHNKVTGAGIGADDRAGCAMLWKLRNLGHSILITSGEEIGQISAEWIMTDPHWKQEIANHQFAIQIDRRGYNDAVFYRAATSDFAKYIIDQTGYIPKDGGRTDICKLCVDICGVNLSTGYYYEHTSEEKLILSHWINTYSTVKRLLTSKKIPKFELGNRPKYFVPHNNNTNYNHGYLTPHNDQSWYMRHQRLGATGKSNIGSAANSTPLIIQDDQDACPILCDQCGHRMTQMHWFESLLSCTKCGKML